jgi:hypothetical protein
MPSSLRPALIDPEVPPGAPLRLERGLLPAALVEEATATLADLVEACLGAPAPGDLDAKVDALRAQDRRRLGLVYDAFRETAVFRQLITAPALLGVASQMLGARRLHSPFQHAVFRLDLAGEHWRGFGWHQDFAYNVLSNDYVTVWAPLTPAGPHNGSIQVAPSLSDRIWPVEIRYKRDETGNSLGTRDAFIADRLQPQFDAAAETLSLDPGDVVLFHNRLVHRSGYNPGPRHRYSIQVRFGDLFAPEMAERGWRHRRADGFDTFKSLFPHLVEYEEV